MHIFRINLLLLFRFKLYSVEFLQSFVQARLRVLNEAEVLLICINILWQRLIDIITYRSDAIFFQLL